MTPLAPAIQTGAAAGDGGRNSLVNSQLATEYGVRRFVAFRSDSKIRASTSPTDRLTPNSSAKRGSLAGLCAGTCRVCLLIALLSVSPADAAPAKLPPEAAKAWDKYLEWADQKVQRELADGTRFLIQDYLPSQEKANALRRLKAGEVVVQRMKGVIPAGAGFDIHDAAIHHWWGSILVPQIRLEDLLPFLQDYDHHAGRFLEVEKSRLLSKQGENYKFSFRLKRSKAIVTVYYNTEQECAYRIHSSGRASSRSWATKIAELENPETPRERELSAGEDRGFLWRLVSWWRFQQTDDGVIVECESASLSRGIPFLISMVPGLRGYLESVPRESLENTLSSIRRHAPTWKKP